MRKQNLKFLNKIISAKDALFLSAITFLFTILRIPSLIEPHWYGDEGIYQVIAMAMNRGRILYEGIWDNKPPLLYVIYAIFDGDLFYARLMSLVVGIFSVIIFFFFVKKLFASKKTIYLSTAVFSFLFAIPTLEGNIANAENFMLLPIIASFYIVFASPFKKKTLELFIAGILLSFAFLIKIVALFDFAALAFILFSLSFYENNSLWKNTKDLLRKTKVLIGQEFILSIAFVTPIIITSFVFIVLGAFPDFVRATFLQNVGYVGHGNDFIFPNGLLIIKLLILIVSAFLIFCFSKKIGKNGVIILIWLAFSVYNVFFSQRPYTHYVLVMLPAFSLFVGYILEDKKLLKFTLPILIVLLLVINSTFQPKFTKNIAYYTNYLEFITEKKNTAEYLSFFDRNTPRDYFIADFIRLKTAAHENVFLWSDSGQIYAMSDKMPPGRYIVAYHITFYPDGISETKKALETSRPKYIIQTKAHDAINNFLDNYELRYKMEGVNIYEREN